MGVTGGHPRHVAVVGAGLAGIAAALRLSEAGVRVTLLETRKRPGGRATSFDDVRSGERVDNCQHVLMRCCTNYIDLLERLGVGDRVTWHDAQYWVEAGGRVSVIRRHPLPSPAQFSPSFLRAGFLTLRDTNEIAWACLGMLRDDRTRYDDRSFGEYLRSAGQSSRVIDRFWSPVVVSACNLDIDRVSAMVAMHVFQEGFLANARAADIGVPDVPLVDLYARLESILADRGSCLRLGVSVGGITATSVTAGSGETITSDAVICAVPFERVHGLVGEDDRSSDPRFAAIESFTHSPILGVHLTFDRPVMPYPHAVLVERATQWVFRKDGAGTRVHAVVSAADEWMDLSEERITQRVLEDMHACLPGSRGAAVTSVRAVKERRATFAPVPGLSSRRPGPTGPSGIILAGDYTDTGWPATMEGATRSGYMAASSVIGDDPRSGLVPALEIARIPSMLGLRAGPVV